MKPKTIRNCDAGALKKRKLAVIGSFCREQRKWNCCSYYQTKSRLCFDSCCGSLLFHKAIENSISVPRNGKSRYARRLTTAAGNKQETSSFQNPFIFLGCFCVITLGPRAETTNGEYKGGRRWAVFRHLWCFFWTRVSLCAQTSTSAPSTAPATISASTLPGASSACVIKATSSTASHTVEVSTANSFPASALLPRLFSALPLVTHTFGLRSPINLVIFEYISMSWFTVSKAVRRFIYI